MIPARFKHLWQRTRPPKQIAKYCLICSKVYRPFRRIDGVTGTSFTRSGSPQSYYVIRNCQKHDVCAECITDIMQRRSVDQLHFVIDGGMTNERDSLGPRNT